MCIARAYVDKNGERGLLMEEISRVEVRDGKLLVKTLFGEQKEMVANIREIDFLTHSIVLENVRD